MTRNIPNELTVEECATLITGQDFWSTHGVESAEIPSIIMTDGPHGLRLQTGSSDHLGLSDSVPATCFPPAVTLGSSFDTAIAERVGAAIASEALANHVGVVLGPGINIKRSPLCGRNFEYFSEDPLISGALGAALINGLQSKGVGGSVKHFAVNNQEADRMRISADVAPRALREIYLRGFERVIRSAAPWTVMCSYNKINGVLASENHWLLTEVLRDQWGYEGLVVSDWGAVADRVRAVQAGLDLEMPGNPTGSVPRVVQAVESGELDEQVLQTSAQRMADLARKVQNPAAGTPADLEANHALAREAAARGVVLLKNEENLLPLAPGKRIAVIGEFARTPRYQGAGSSLVNPTRVENLLDELRAAHGEELVDFAPGYTMDVDAGLDAELAIQTLESARGADTLVLVLGLPTAAESEGFDRIHIKLPAAQLALVDAVRSANARVIVALVGGGVVELPFADEVPTLVAAWLGGQAGGGGLADVLTGRVNPSGRLAETIPMRIEDTPAALDFPGEHGHVSYGEGIFVGYRWYDARKMEVRYPFGHGLSYTTFDYSNLVVEESGEGLRATLSVTNTGNVTGRDVIQLFVGRPGSDVSRPPLSLGAFGTTAELQPGESCEVTLQIERSELVYWDVRVDQWVIEPGTYEVTAAASSRDLRATATIDLAGDAPQIPISMESTIGDLLAIPEAAEILGGAMAQFMPEPTEEGAEGQDMSVLMASFPIGRLPNFPNMPFTREQIEQLLSGISSPK